MASTIPELGDPVNETLKQLVGRLRMCNAGQSTKDHVVPPCERCTREADAIETLMAKFDQFLSGAYV